MDNIFIKQNYETVPKNINECRQIDPVSSNLWTWASWIETIGKITAVIIAVALAFVGLVFAEESDGVSLLLLLAAPIGAFLQYCTYHIVALRIGSLASIVQNTKISANIAMYSFKNEDSTETIEEKKESNDNNEIEHMWRCTDCGKMISQTPCPFCAKKPKETPYWCLTCGQEGPYNGNCPVCGSSIKIYNTK